MVRAAPCGILWERRGGEFRCFGSELQFVCRGFLLLQFDQPQRAERLQDATGVVDGACQHLQPHGRRVTDTIGFMACVADVPIVRRQGCVRVFPERSIGTFGIHCKAADITFGGRTGCRGWVVTASPVLVNIL